MSIDQDGISGFGKQLSDEELRIVISNLAPEEDGKDLEEIDVYTILDEGSIHPLRHAQAGNAFSGESTWYLAVKGDTPKKLVLNTEPCIDKFEELGLTVTEDDLYMFEDVYVS